MRTQIIVSLKVAYLVNFNEFRKDSTILQNSTFRRHSSIPRNSMNSTKSAEFRRIQLLLPNLRNAAGSAELLNSAESLSFAGFRNSAEFSNSQEVCNSGNCEELLNATESEKWKEHGGVPRSAVAPACCGGYTVAVGRGSGGYTVLRNKYFRRWGFSGPNPAR